MRVLSRLPRVCRHAVAVMWTRHPFVFLSGIVFLSVCCFTWFCYGRGDEKTLTSHLWRSQRLFAVEGQVTDISNGSMETLSSLLKSAEIKFVLFYAPWCGQSRRIAPEFSHTAQLLYQEVSFIAVNCWLGSCRQNHVLDSFPKLFAYHTRFSGVEYTDEGKSWKFVQFLKNVIRPLVYIGNQKELSEFQINNEDTVMSYFTPDSLNSRNYSIYFGTALHSQGQVRKARYGLITSEAVAELAGLRESGQIVLQGYSAQKQVYPKNHNFTVQNITQWVEKNVNERLVVELSPNQTNSKYIAEQLNRGPALILFLPLKKRKISNPLLTLLKTLGFEYHNCSCSSTGHFTTTGSVSDTHDRASPKKPTFTVVENMGGITAKNKLIYKQTTTCVTILRDYHNKSGNKRNVCDICQSCVKDCSYEDNLLLKNLTPRIIRAVPHLASTCTTFRTGYHNRFTTSVCCSYRAVALNRHVAQNSDLTFDSIKNYDSEFSGFVNSLIDKMLKSLGPKNEETKNLLVASAKLGNDSAVVTVRDGKVQVRAAQPIEAPQESQNIAAPQDLQVNLPKLTEELPKDKCNRTGHVTEFRKAGCHSNRSVNFFYMDSGRYWPVAERLGVLSCSEQKLALVIVDLKNEAQYVLNETTELTNKSIVDFVMHFMSGSLERRLKSSPPQTPAMPSECPATHACVVEVITANFHTVVLNNSKDVLVMFYAPWCGYCRAIYPVYLGLARVFRHVKNLVIARIDADANDLPWELTVTEYPTFILFPAKRKDFSVTYPKSKERTFEGFMEFILSHASRETVRSHYGEESTGCADNLERTHSLTLQLQEAEEAARLLQIRLDESVKEKQVVEHKYAVAVKDLIKAKMITSREKERRLEAEEENREMLDNLISTEKRLWKESRENVRLRGQVAKIENQIMDIHDKIYLARQKTEKISREKRRVLSSLRKAVSDSQIIQKLTSELRILRGNLGDSEVSRKLVSKMLEMEKQERLKASESSNLLQEENFRLQEELRAKVNKISFLEQSLNSVKAKLQTLEKHNQLLEISERTTKQQLKEVEKNYLKFTHKLNNLEIPKKKPVR